MVLEMNSNGALAILGTIISTVVLIAKALLDTLNRSSERIKLLEAKLDTVEEQRAELRKELDEMRGELMRIKFIAERQADDLAALRKENIELREKLTHYQQKET